MLEISFFSCSPSTSTFCRFFFVTYAYEQLSHLYFPSYMHDDMSQIFIHLFLYPSCVVLALLLSVKTMLRN
jgi:hypothetical protein